MRLFHLLVLGLQALTVASAPTDKPAGGNEESIMSDLGDPYINCSGGINNCAWVSLAAMRGQDTKALYADLKKAGATAAQQAKFDKSISALDFKPIAAKLGTVKELSNGAHPSSKLKAEGAPTGKNIMLWVEMEGTKNHVVWGKLDASGKGQYWDHQGHSNADTANKLVNEGNVYYAMWYE